LQLVVLSAVMFRASMRSSYTYGLRDAVLFGFFSLPPPQFGLGCIFRCPLRLVFRFNSTSTCAPRYGVRVVGLCSKATMGLAPRINIVPNESRVGRSCSMYNLTTLSPLTLDDIVGGTLIDSNAGTVVEAVIELSAVLVPFRR
jgi:hypothetical protein